VPNRYSHSDFRPPLSFITSFPPLNNLESWCQRDLRRLQREVGLLTLRQLPMYLETAISPRHTLVLPSPSARSLHRILRIETELRVSILGGRLSESVQNHREQVCISWLTLKLTRRCTGCVWYPPRKIHRVCFGSSLHSRSRGGSICLGVSDSENDQCR